MKHCSYKNWGLFIVRLTLGSIFFAHGAQKVFGIFGGKGMNAFLAWTASMGVPTLCGYLAAWAELLGGIMLFCGIAVEIGALITIPVMLGAVFLVHWDNGYFAQHGGFEYPLNLIFLSVAIIVGGPGRCIIWDPFNRS